MVLLFTGTKTTTKQEERERAATEGKSERGKENIGETKWREGEREREREREREGEGEREREREREREGERERERERGKQANDSWRRSLQAWFASFLKEINKRSSAVEKVWSSLLIAGRRRILKCLEEQRAPLSPVTAGTSLTRNTVAIHRPDHLSYSVPSHSRSSKPGTANNLQTNALLLPTISLRHGGCQRGGTEHPAEDLEQTAKSPQC